jgi:hypothetical protein
LNALLGVFSVILYVMEVVGHFKSYGLLFMCGNQC